MLEHWISENKLKQLIRKKDSKSFLLAITLVLQRSRVHMNMVIEKSQSDGDL